MSTLPWRIDLLGGLRVTHGERVLARFRTEKTGALLGYLACHPGTGHPREALADLLWPDSDPEASHNSLRVALSSLRRQLEPPGVDPGTLLVASRATVGLNPQVVTTDVADFQEALEAARRTTDADARAGHLGRAAGLYQGPLLPGVYEEWVLPECERLAEQLLAALKELAAYHGQAGDFPLALDYARRAVAADPLREDAHRELMRLYALAGDPQAALREYRRLQRVLSAELGTTPDDATRALMRGIRQGTFPPAGKPAVAPAAPAPPPP
ncbi:MAG: winged helix-turn-helix domain-containing protein, partial [Armatimonadetes bacterium]|nr:winged helix-turn-helix domain-containing protein [Armatimonadota bacterium]